MPRNKGSGVNGKQKTAEVFVGPLDGMIIKREKNGSWAAPIRFITRENKYYYMPIIAAKGRVFYTLYGIKPREDNDGEENY